MGLFGFGRKKDPQPARPDPPGLPAQHPAVRFQLDYWKPQPAEKESLEQRGVENLDWPALLRLHHLACMERLDTTQGRHQLQDADLDDDEDPADSALLRQTTQRLFSADSPYRPKDAAVWQGKAGTDTQREPNLSGELWNPSLTHLGSLEVIRVDPQMQPLSIGFVGLDEIRGLVCAPPALFRGAKLFYDDGRPDEIVLLPILYGTSWRGGHDFDRDGTMTRFCCHQDVGAFMPLGIGVGQQDWAIIKEKQSGMRAFGLGSVQEVMIGLRLDDPKFEQKCRARGLDPAEIRRRAAMQPPPA